MTILPIECRTNLAAYIDLLLCAYLEETGLSEGEIESISLDLKREEFSVTAAPVAPMQSVTLEVRIND